MTGHRYMTRIRQERADAGPERRVFYVAEYSDGSVISGLSLDQLGDIIEGKMTMRLPIGDDWRNIYGSNGQ
jgi:hypothetical protein